MGYGCPGRDVHHGAPFFRIRRTQEVSYVEVVAQGVSERETVSEGRAQPTVTWRRTHRAVSGRRRSGTL